MYNFINYIDAVAQLRTLSAYQFVNIEKKKLIIFWNNVNTKILILIIFEDYFILDIYLLQIIIISWTQNIDRKWKFCIEAIINFCACGKKYKVF